jgi:hypothetical protein
VTSDRILRIGVVVTAIGLVATLIAILPLFNADIELPGYWWFLSMITGVGLTIIIAGFIMGARERRPPR